MFTGLVETTGVLQQRRGNRLIVKPEKQWDDLVYGESIAVNGCCLTLEKTLPGGGLEFFTLEETLRRTNLGQLPPGSPVNMERAMCAGGRLGGHIVQGHVDAASPVLELRRLPDGDMALKIGLDIADAPLVVEKGSVAIDGVSLTVVEAEKEFFSVRLIPVTLKETALAKRSPGMPVNVEFDIIGRYVIRQLQCRENSTAAASSITMDTLRDAGFF